MNNYTLFLHDLKTALPKKIINTVADEVESKFKIIRKDVDETSGRYTRTFTVEDVSDVAVAVVCNLVWEDSREDGNTPKGFFINLTGSCSDGKRTINDDKQDYIEGYHGKHELSDLIKIAEDWFLDEWCYAVIDDFIADIKKEFKNN